jgi:hypothetical protein
MIDLSNDGRLALNDQWIGGDVNDLTLAQIEIYDLGLTYKGIATLPEAYCTSRGLAFDDDGLLYVTSQHGYINDNGTPEDTSDDYFGSWTSEVFVFDKDYNYLSTILLNNTGGEVGDITFRPVPEPTSGLAILFGYLMFLKRRKKST